MKDEKKIKGMLEHYRRKVEKIDGQIVDLSGQRLKLVRKIELYKRKLGKPVTDLSIEKRRLDLVEEKAKTKNLGKEFPKIMRSLFSFLIGEYRNIEIKQRKSAEKK
jgi:chorismate mutase